MIYTEIDHQKTHFYIIIIYFFLSPQSFQFSIKLSFNE